MEHIAQVREILAALLPSADAQWEITRLCHEEDGAPYDVWRIDAGEKRWILKKAKEYEYEVYTSFSQSPAPMCPSWKMPCVSAPIAICWSSLSPVTTSKNAPGQTYRRPWTV